MDGLVLPGVGAFPAGMAAIRALGLDELLQRARARGRAAAGAVPGDAAAVRALRGARRRDGPGAAGGHGAPVERAGTEAAAHRLERGALAAGDAAERGSARPGVPVPRAQLRAVRPADEDVVLATADYGEPFAAIVGQGNVFGTQSHPEKSSAHGLALLANFTRLCGSGDGVLRDPVPGDRHPRRQRGAAGEGRLRRAEGLRRGPAGGRARLGRRQGARYLHVVDLDGAKTGEP